MPVPIFEILDRRMLYHYRAYRHRRGYGVHSPYAFMLATEVLAVARGYGYYGEIKARAALAGRHRGLFLAALRYAWRFGYSSFDGDLRGPQHDRRWECWRSMAGIAVSGGRRMAAGTEAVRLVAAATGGDSVVVAYGDAAEVVKAAIEAECMTGVLFHYTGQLMYFPNPKVRFVSYEYRFR